MTNSVAVPDTVTVCITSCGRLDLLAETLATFGAHNTGAQLLISEDSADDAVIAKVRAAYPDARILTSAGRTGIMASIDRLYSAVTTPYILHLEDDWAFDGPVDFAASLALLEARTDIANVCVRAITEIKEKYRNRSDPLTHAGAQFRVMHRSAHPEFYAWSPNPGLIRRDLYTQFAPFSRVNPDRMSGVMKEAGLTQAFLLPGVARHIGYGRNVPDPTMPVRPKSRPAKWLRAVKKKLYYAGLRKEPF
jgi:Glycosyltransferase like family 2